MIRDALITDLDEIESIERASFEEPWSRASVEAEFYKDYSHFFVYEENGILAGYIIIWDLGPEWEVVTVAVAERFRQKGIGRKLLDYALILSGAGAEWRLEVACDNEAAIRLYESYGFVEAGVIKNYYGQGRNAFRMLREAVSLRGNEA